MATMNISLPDQMKAFVEDQTKDGRFSNSSDYMRDLIRRDQERRQAIAEIQALVDEAMASGPGRPYDMAKYIAERKSR